MESNIEEGTGSSAPLIRLAIGSFRKPVALWDRNDAPVRGKRFEAYLRIARLMLAQL